MDKFEEIEKKVSFADFLIGRSESSQYASGAIKHVLGAAEMLFQELTGLNEYDSKSPQIIQNAAKKFKEEEVSGFSRFYITLMQKADKVSISIPEVEEDIRKLRKYISAIKKLKKK